MPSYRYTCSKCDHEQNNIVSFEDRQKSQKCEECGSKAKYVISAPVVWDDVDTRWIRQHEVEGNGIRSNG